MNIDGLLEELDHAEFDCHTEKTPSSSGHSISLPKKQGTELSESNGTAKESIDSLLQGLDGSMFDENDDFFPSMSEGKLTARKPEAADELKGDEIDREIETAKKESSSKYSAIFGHDIHKKLKESRSTSNQFNGVQRSWKSRTAPERACQLAVSTTVVTGKLDVYAEPTFGLRLVNPVVSSQFIQSKMAGKQPVAISNIPYHLW